MCICVGCGSRGLCSFANPETLRSANSCGAANPASLDRGGTACRRAPENAADLAATVVHHGDGVAATVNDSVISDYDLKQRIALFVATSGVRPSANSLNAIRDQVLKQLETEQMELIEAKKENITVSAGDVDRAINDIVKSNHISLDQLKSVLAHGGVEYATLRAQISTQIAWSKLVQEQLGDRVHVTPEDVNAELARIKAGSNKPHYLVGEIFEAVDSPEQDAKVQKDMSDLDNQIQAGCAILLRRAAVQPESRRPHRAAISAGCRKARSRRN